MEIEFWKELECPFAGICVSLSIQKGQGIVICALLRYFWSLRRFILVVSELFFFYKMQASNSCRALMRRKYYILWCLLTRTVFYKKFPSIMRTYWVPRVDCKNMPSYSVVCLSYPVLLTIIFISVALPTWNF